MLLEDFEILHHAYSNIFAQIEGKKVLIVGATGMITSYLSKFLIYLLASFSFELYLHGRNEEKLATIYGREISNEHVHFVSFDFEKNQMPLFRPDFIIHAASPASTKAFFETPVNVISPNIIGTWNLLNWAKEIKVHKFLFFSSVSIYGEGGLSKTILSEDDYGIVNPLCDRSSYVESKRTGEQMCCAFWKQYNVPTSIIRIRHTFGPTFDLSQDTRIVPKVIKKITEKKDIEIYKDPSALVQFTYIADLAAAILFVALRGKNGEAYNAAGNEVVRMDDVVDWMIHSDNHIQSKLIEKEIDSNYNFSKGKGINYLKLSNDKLKSLGWNQIYEVKEGFERTVRYYLDNNRPLL